jgi:hypothetical protein
VTRQISLGFEAKVNFQPDGAPVPAGYVKDNGSVYDPKPNGLIYGWNATAHETRHRGATGDQRYDTLVHFDDENYPTDRSWNISVPNGRYRVAVVMGDPVYTDQTNDVEVEGVLLPDPDPKDTYEWSGSYEYDNWDRYTTVVDVADGRLTIEPTGGSYNAKLAFVHVTGLDPRPFNQSDGQVVVEAEHFVEDQPGTNLDDGPDDGDDMRGTSWWIENESTASSGQWVRGVPNYDGWFYDGGWENGYFHARDTTNGPRLDYDVHFNDTGTYYVWVRVKCGDQDSNEIHVGLEGTPDTYGSDGFAQDCASDSGYTWINQHEGSLVSLDVTTTGVHTLNLWMSDDGVVVDKVVLTTDASYVPTGQGPHESERHS